MVKQDDQGISVMGIRLRAKLTGQFNPLNSVKLIVLTQTGFGFNKKFLLKSINYRH